MNIQSWIILFLLMSFCSYVVYTRYIAKTKGGCRDCKKSNKNACSKCN